jgi:type II secretory pathway component PulJ
VKLLRRLKKCKGQRGLGVLEIAVSLAITALIGLGAAVATVQVVTQTSRNSDYTAGVTQVLNAMHWMGRDVQMAQTVTPDGGGTGFPLDITWVEWDNTSHVVTYAADGNLMTRTHYIDSVEQDSMTVARYINWTAANTTVAQTSDNVVQMRITATVGSGSNAMNVTKLRNVIPRPGL